MMLSWCHRSGGQHQQFKPPPAPHAASHSGTERRGAPAIVRAALGTRMPRRVGSRWVRSGMPCVGLRRGTRAGDELTTAPWGKYEPYLRIVQRICRLPASISAACSPSSQAII